MIALMEARVVRAGFQRALRLVSTQPPRAIPPQPTWARPSMVTSLANGCSHPSLFHVNAVKQDTSRSNDRFYPRDEQTSGLGRYGNERRLDAEEYGNESIEDLEGYNDDGSDADARNHSGDEVDDELSNYTDEQLASYLSEASPEDIEAMARRSDDSPEPDIYNDAQDLSNLRVVPASPSYFTGQPRFTDDMLRLTSLLHSTSSLPTCAPGEAPRVSWITYSQYTASNSEPIRKSRYAQLLRVVARLNQIRPELVPEAVRGELKRWMRAVQPSGTARRPLVVDRFGRSRAVGRRKTSSAVVWLVEGDGQVRVNGRGLTDFFGRLHDRDSAVWPLKATARLDRYNVWAIVRGGGTTGQAEAITLGLAKALMVQEPALKPALRRAGCVRSDPRQVERKKAGRLKARKKPAWVRR